MSRTASKLSVTACTRAMLLDCGDALAQTIRASPRAAASWGLPGLRCAGRFVPARASWRDIRSSGPGAVSVCMLNAAKRPALWDAAFSQLSRSV